MAGWHEGPRARKRASSGNLPVTFFAVPKVPWVTTIVHLTMTVSQCGRGLALVRCPRFVRYHQFSAVAHTFDVPQGTIIEYCAIPG